MLGEIAQDCSKTLITLLDRDLTFTLRSDKVRVTEIIPLLIPEKDTPDFEDTMKSVLHDKVAPKARGNIIMQF
jgi:hypothetical protein